MAHSDDCVGEDTTEEAQQHRSAAGTDTNSAGVYRRGALLYWKAGWPAPLPFPPGAKAPPLAGWTGYDGKWPDEQQIETWVCERPPLSNLGNRLYYGLIGIDTDAYEPKTGGRTLAEAEARWGRLPNTYRSTARIEDTVSGIRVFGVPVGVVFRSVIRFKDLGLGDIEIIQPHQRVVICWPSIHPNTGEQYRWFGPDGTLLPEGVVPNVDDIPELPESWVVGLARDSVREEIFDGSAPNRPQEENAVLDEEVYHRLQLMVDDGPPDPVVRARAERALLDLTAGSGSRYDTARDHVAALMRLRAVGRVGVPRVLTELFSAYVAEVADTRPQQVAQAEFRRFTERAALLIAGTPSPDPWMALGMDGAGTGVNGSSHQDGVGGRDGWGVRMLRGGSFVLDAPEAVETLWGSDDRVIWADGEGLMLTGTQGVGKTTLAQQLVLALLGVVSRSVLGLPVVGEGRRVLYLAMDRPNQIRRAFRRQCRDDHRHLLDENLVIWQGPPPADLAKNTELLTELAEQAKADVVVVDSLKDAAVGLSEDEVGSGWNRAAQGLLASGRNLLVLHHRKKRTNGTQQTGLDDVYGSTWLTSGMGSVVLLDGHPGDPLVKFRHLKFPVAEVGPMEVSHDQASGLMTVAERVDLLAVARAEGKVTAKHAADLLYGRTRPNEVEKARRQLEKLVSVGSLIKKNEGGVTVYYPSFGAAPSAREQEA